MSENTGQDGVKTHPGGGTAAPPPSPPVTNQPLLVLDSNVVATLTPAEARQLAIIQVEFAAGVSRLAADAYDRVLSLLRG